MNFAKGDIMKQFKHVNPKDFLHKVYTEEGGVKEHNKNQQAVGILKLAGVIWAIQKIGCIAGKIGSLPIKALEIQKDEEPPCS